MRKITLSQYQQAYAAPFWAHGRFLNRYLKAYLNVAKTVRKNLGGQSVSVLSFGTGYNIKYVLAVTNPDQLTAVDQAYIDQSRAETTPGKQTYFDICFQRLVENMSSISPNTVPTRGAGRFNFVMPLFGRERQLTFVEATLGKNGSCPAFDNYNVLLRENANIGAIPEFRTLDYARLPNGGLLVTGCANEPVSKTPYEEIGFKLIQRFRLPTLPVSWIKEERKSIVIFRKEAKISNHP